LREELETMAKELGLLHALIFTGMRKDVADILAALDVLVLSSLWEGLPVILLEAMAAARPVVSTAVDGVRSVVIPDKSALLVDTNSPSALAQACIKLARNPELREKMGRAGLKRVSEFYSLDAMIDRISGLYTDLLNERGLGEFSQFPVKESGFSK
jgi:glycosyltransferase involved in cell wall biosynthesis